MAFPPRAILLCLAVAAVPLRAQARLELAPAGPIEVTQGVQSPSNSVPLVAGRGAWARVYLTAAGAPPGRISGKLLVASGLATDTLDAEAVLAGSASVRTSWGSSLNFRIPAEVAAQGEVRLELLEISRAADGARLPCAACAGGATIVAFGPPVTLRLRLVGFRYTRDDETYTPRPADFAGVQSWLESAFPVSRVEVDTVTVTAFIDVPTCRSMNTVLARIRALDLAGGQDPRTHYYGLVRDALKRHPEDGAMQGCAFGIPGTPDASTVASGAVGTPSDTDQAAWVKGPTYAGHYAGHELAHTLGRRHPGYCGESADDPERDPAGRGSIGTAANGYLGVDLVAGGVYPAAGWYDLMTYCNPRWIGGRTFTALMERIAAEDALYAAEPPPPAGGFISAGSEAAGDSILELIAEFHDLEKPSGRIRAAFTTWRRGRPAATDSAAPLDTPMERHAVVEVVYGGSRIRYPTPVMPTRGGLPAAGPLRGSGWVHAFVPGFPGEGWIRLLRGGVLVDSVYKSATPTRLAGVSRTILRDGATVLGYLFSWTPDPAGAEPIVYVQASFDGGSQWRVIRRTAENQVGLSCALIRRHGSVRIRLITADRVLTAAAYESGELVQSANDPCRPEG